MSSIKNIWLALALGIVAHSSAHAQMDPIAYVQQLANYYGQQAEASARYAVQCYRQETGDWSTPDQQVMNYLIQQSRQQNPEWYADLQRREAAFQQHQQQYAAHSNAILDGMYNSYMQRSQWQHQAHQNYIRENIWERGLYTDNSGSTYELPYYQPYQSYDANNGSQLYQDGSGVYYQYDNAGWGSQLYEYVGE